MDPKERAHQERFLHVKKEKAEEDVGQAPKEEVNCKAPKEEDFGEAQKEKDNGEGSCQRRQCLFSKEKGVGNSAPEKNKGQHLFLLGQRTIRQSHSPFQIRVLQIRISVHTHT
mmetsp:Transcript_17818/g.38989  ORF Transcript_17818/g.38989 Transcript_17818/m.38989 type:complete len:113 (-) Transcript_17818:56-394(-)